MDSPLFPCFSAPGLDASSYRSRDQEDGGGDEDVGGDGGVADPFEGTDGLLVTCAGCRSSMLLHGSNSQVSRSVSTCIGN